MYQLLRRVALVASLRMKFLWRSFSKLVVVAFATITADVSAFVVVSTVVSPFVIPFFVGSDSHGGCCC